MLYHRTLRVKNQSSSDFFIFPPRAQAELQKIAALVSFIEFAMPTSFRSSPLIE
jgi:hypothetical protein